MFHYRWKRQEDIDLVALRLASEGNPDSPPEQHQKAAEMIKERMGSTSESGGRGFAVGSNDVTSPLIEASFQEGIKLLDAHLADRAFLFGAAPVFGDFGLGLQVYQALIDPTAGGILREQAPNVVRWAEDMVSPKAVGDGALETWETLEPTLAPFLSTAVSRFLTWSSANSKAIAEGAEEMEVDLGAGGLWWQTVGGPQKYHAKSLKVLQEKYAAAATSALDDVLAGLDCLAPLQVAAEAKL